MDKLNELSDLIDKRNVLERNVTKIDRTFFFMKKGFPAIPKIEIYCRENNKFFIDASILDNLQNYQLLLMMKTTFKEQLKEVEENIKELIKELNYE